MQFQLNQQIIEAILLTAKACPKRPTHPILGCLKVEASQSQGEVSVTGFDLSVGITRSVPSDFIESGSICLPAGLLTEIIKGESEGSLEADPETYQATLRVGGSEFKLQGMGVDDYPAFPESDNTYSLGIPLESLNQALDAARYAISTDPTKQILTGLNFNTTAGEVAATDGHRLAVCQLEYEFSTPEPAPSFTLPESALSLVGAVIASLPRDTTLGMTYTESTIEIECGDTVVVSRLQEGNYPNYRQLIPKEFSQEVTLNTKECLTALKRAIPISKKGNNTIKFQGGCTPIGVKELHISTVCPDVGSMKTSVVIQDDGEMTEEPVGFNTTYLVECLSKIGTSQVTLHMNTPTSPVIITPYNPNQEEPHELHLVMPVQVRENIYL